MDNTLNDLFRTEAETQTGHLADGLLILEKGDAPPETVEALMRAAHSLKGAARIVGLDAAVRVAHVLEDYFVAVQREQVRIHPTHVDVLLRGVDLLHQISQWLDGDANGWLQENESVIAGYAEQLKGIIAGKEQPPSPPAVKALAAPQPEVIEVQPAEPPPPPPAPSVRTEEPPPAAVPAERTDRVVRVSADSLDRLMGLAGESLVEARQFRRLLSTSLGRQRQFVGALRALKQAQEQLQDHVRALQEQWETGQIHGDSASGLLLRQAREQTLRCQELLGTTLTELDDFGNRSEDLAGRLHHEVIASRMRPLAEGLRGFPRMIRDLARQLGKQVELVVRGEQTGVDRDILEKLEAPLTHLLRNAVDHGLEGPEDRQHRGKPPQGTLRLEACHRAGMLQIVVRDDGRGIDHESVRRRIITRGLAPAAMVEQLEEAELFEFLFLPRFSTRDAVSEISGRGVGLDVVQSMIRTVGGTVRITSLPGRETCFTLRLPISMSIIRALLVEIDGEAYAFPLTRIDRLEMLPAERIEWLENRPYFLLDGENVGLVEATQLLDLPEAAPTHALERPVVVLSDRTHRFGLMVQRILGERDLDVRPLDARLGKVPNLSSASVLEDGSPVLIFDVEDMVRNLDNLVGGKRLKGRETLAGLLRKAVKRILVVDDSLTVRELERQLLQNQGYVVDIAVDGMDGWNAARDGGYDLVVSDVDMPRMDGIQLVTRIKQDPRLRATPVVIVSYKDREEDKLRGLEAGANCYLTKSSFHDQSFLTAIADLIGGASS